MSAPDPTGRDAEGRRLAAALFNHVWELLELPGRSRAQDDEMLHAAHASRYHWIAAGTTVNAARGEWQCSRVYATLGRAEPALHHARRCLELVGDAEDAESFDEPFAHEALARAHAVAGDVDAARREAEIARAGAETITDAGSRELVLADLATIPLGGGKIH
jgi:hypothetical protein